jgi:sulfate permease, SulP family
LKLSLFRKRPAYTWTKLAGDLSGGLVAALIALPYGLAMASLMGLPPILGIFTSVLTSPVTALLGRNPVLIGGTGSATVPFIAETVRQQGIGGAAKVSIVAAVIMMAFCVLRLGRHIKSVPHSVVTGFSCGIGLMMLISQAGPIMGINGHSSGNTLAQLAGVLDHLTDFQLAPCITGLVVLFASIASAHLIPSAPAPLIGIIAAFMVGKLFGLREAEIGSLASGLPPFVGFAWTPRDVYTVLPSGFVLALIVSVNILITSRVVEHFRGRHQRMKTSDADAELGAYGIANIFSGMFGAPLSVGIPARSLAVVRCGGSTSLSNIFHAIILIVILKFGTGVISHIPMVALAGVTAWMGLCLLDWSTWRRLQKMARLDAAAFLATAVSVVLVNAVLAVLIGCSFYIVRAAYYRLQHSEERIPDLQMH